MVKLEKKKKMLKFTSLFMTFPLRILKPFSWDTIFNIDRVNSAPLIFKIGVVNISVISRQKHHLKTASELEEEAERHE